MRVVFLDIDGVLNGKHNSSFMAIDSHNMTCLNHLLSETGACVVVSSTWRVSGVDFLQHFLNARGFMGQIVGLTPIMNGGCRGGEILRWLRDAGSIISSYVVLDDNDDLEGVRDHWVHIDDSVGLQPNDVTKAIEILREL